GSLVAAEEEELVLLDGTAQHAAKLILIQDLFRGGTGRVVAIVKEVVGVEDRVAQELERAPVVLIRSGFGDDVNIGPRVSSVAGVISRRLNFELLDRVRVGNADPGIQARIIGAAAVGKVRDVYAVHLEIVLAGIVAVDAHVLRALAQSSGIIR